MIVTAYDTLYSIVSMKGGKMWAIPGRAILYIKSGKLFVYWVDEKYSVSVSDWWCEKYIKRNYCN